MNAVPWVDLALNLLAVTVAIAVFIGAIMATAIRLTNQSIIDIFWGPGFVVAAIVSYLMSMRSGGDDSRGIVVLALTAIWGCDWVCTSVIATGATARTIATPP